jgi:hypothetical protein
MAMGILQWLFGLEADNRERRENDAARKLSPAMAAAGAELQAAPVRSESEEALKRAAESNAPRRAN